MPHATAGLSRIPANGKDLPPMIRVRFTLLGMLAVMVALALAAPRGAQASNNQVVVLQDDANHV
jgi:hypothetical protein